MPKTLTRKRPMGVSIGAQKWTDHRLVPNRLKRS